MKLLHLADVHACPERADDVLHSLTVARERARSESVDLIILAGDTWDGVIRNTRGSRFPELIEGVRSLADIAPVAMIYGTPTHDADGSLEVFTGLETKFGITILEPGVPYWLVTIGEKPQIMPIDPKQNPVAAQPWTKALLFGVPEPSKKFLVQYMGADEAAQSVRDGLRGLFTALGAIRRQYPSLPCILAYHGQVGGARLQNGDMLDNGSGLRPSIDDLAAVGADYIALGDIHEPQQVGNLPAYYPGSAYPKDFGETHEAGCNLVDLYADEPTSVGDPDSLYPVEYEVFVADITSVPFGHPVNVTIKATMVNGWLEPTVTVPPGKRVKLEIRYRKEDGNLDADYWLSKLIAMGSAPGSIVKPDPILTETVRAEEITTKTTLEEKAAVWLTQSKKDYPETLRAKIRQIEADTPKANDAGPERRFRNVSTLIRGSKGFWKNQKKDEVFLDWESLGSGVIAYTGPNGYGKTTSFDFSKPWPVPISRPPKTLKNHFRLRDSLIENVYLDEVSGVRYLSKITIDAGIASGKTEYYLYRDIGDGNGWVILPGIEGRLDGYEQAVEEIFGSLDIYLRTAFAAQKATKDRPDISEATQGEKKALIAELAGKDGFGVYQQVAKAIGDAAEKALVPKVTEISTLEARLPNEAELLADIDYHQGTLNDARTQMNILAETGKEARAKVEALGIQVAADKDTAQKIGEIERLLAEIGRGMELKRSVLVDNQQTIAQSPAARETVATHDRLTKELAALDEAYRQNLEARQAEQIETDRLRKEHDDAQRKDRDAFAQVQAEYTKKLILAQREEQNAGQLVYRLQTDERAIQAEIERLTKELEKPVEDHCPTCRQMLPSDALEHVQKSRDEVRLALKDAEERLMANAKDLITAQSDIAAKATARRLLESQAPAQPIFPPFTPPPSKVPAWNDSDRLRIKSQLGYINVEQALSVIQAASQAQVRIEELTKQLADLEATAKRERTRADELRAQLRPELDAEFAQAQAEHQRYQDLYRDAQKREAQADAALTQARQRLEAMAKDRQQIDALKTALSGLQADVAEWRFVETVIEGVRDLELDALAPHIAAVATKILASSGRTGTIRIDTTRLSSEGGKRARQIEDFKIMYIGADGEEQDIATCSGGEMVWQRKALYDAFGVIRARNARLRWTTGLLDETDGALFPEDRVNYFRMLEAGHAESGRYQTILITQSVEIAEMAQARIDVRELTGRK